MARFSNPDAPLPTLMRLGQSVWLDYIHRDLLRSGELKRLIETRGVRGVTTNPTIFEQAIGKSETYDEAIGRLAGLGMDTAEIVEALASEDVAEACDLFQPIYEMSGGNDGFVSIEVSPKLARDAGATIVEARRLWKAVNRPNVLIKIPGTAEALPAVTQAIAEGINVNVTLLFAVTMYERVIEAYLTGLEQRLAAGQPVEALRSVASFFVSRVDSEVDRRLEAKLQADPSLRLRIEALLGTAAIANAKLAYQTYVAWFEAERFRHLMARGAAVQRPLWASTSTKNPRYSETIYVEGLIGPDTINTLPPATLEAFATGGIARRTIDADLDTARRQLADLAGLGIAMKDVTDFLVVDGVKKFADSYAALLLALDAKRAQLAAHRA
jgi:transaldolase